MKTLRRLRTLVLALAIAAACGACGLGGTPYTTALEEAEGLVRAGSYEDAYRAYDRLRRRHPDEPVPYRRLAWLATRLRRPRQAIPAIEERAARGGPEAHVYFDLLGTLQERANLLDEAEASYREALRLNANYALAHRKLSRLMTRSGRYTEALEIAQEGVARFPQDAALRSWYGDLLMALHRWSDAERELQRAVALGATGAYPHFVLGLVYLNAGRPAEARPELEEATRLEPLVANHWYQLANACEQLGDDPARDRALARFDSVLRQRLGVRSGADSDAEELDG